MVYRANFPQYIQLYSSTRILCDDWLKPDYYYLIQVYAVTFITTSFMLALLANIFFPVSFVLKSRSNVVMLKMVCSVFPHTFFQYLLWTLCYSEWLVFNSVGLPFSCNRVVQHGFNIMPWILFFFNSFFMGMQYEY